MSQRLQTGLRLLFDLLLHGRQHLLHPTELGFLKSTMNGWMHEWAERGRELTNLLLQLFILVVKHFSGRCRRYSIAISIAIFLCQHSRPESLVVNIVGNFLQILRKMNAKNKKWLNGRYKTRLKYLHVGNQHGSQFDKVAMVGILNLDHAPAERQCGKLKTVAKAIESMHITDIDGLESFFHWPRPKCWSRPRRRASSLSGPELVSCNPHPHHCVQDIRDLLLVSSIGPFTCRIQEESRSWCHSHWSLARSWPLAS